jgi:amidase
MALRPPTKLLLRVTKDKGHSRFLDCVAGRPGKRDEEKRPATALGMKGFTWELFVRWELRFGATIGAKMDRVSPVNNVSPLSPSAPDIPQDADSDICFVGAADLEAMICAKKLSAAEVMTAHLRQIARVNPKVNAVVTLVPEDELMAQARAADQSLAKGRLLGPLHGLPVGVKDLEDTKGIRTTYGSPLFREHIPDRDALIVERMKNAGAIVVGKTNTPEFGMGSQTFNTVFGATLNPYDTTKTCGGSTGGGAVAVACGMASLASGSDMGGSLRNPPNFCNVVGMRPSPGRVPNDSSTGLGWFTLSVSGPVARNVTDCALLLSVQAGFDRQSPISIAESGSQFAQPLGRRTFKGVRIAMIKDLGLPWEPAVMAAFGAQRNIFESLGCIVEQAEPDMTDANECFRAWRHWMYELALGDLVDAHPDQVNAYGHFHVEEGRKLTGPYLSRVEGKRSALYQRMREFMEKYEFLALPVNQVLPFDVQTRYPTEIAGVKMEDYIAWMKSTYYISTVGNPAISVPCAFSEDGLPIGIQIVGRHNDDLGVLQMGYAFEQATNIGKRRPVVA